MDAWDVDQLSYDPILHDPVFQTPEMQHVYGLYMQLRQTGLSSQGSIKQLMSEATDENQVELVLKLSSVKESIDMEIEPLLQSIAENEMVEEPTTPQDQWTDTSTLMSMPPHQEQSPPRTGSEQLLF